MESTMTFKGRQKARKLDDTEGGNHKKLSTDPEGWYSGVPIKKPERKRREMQPKGRVGTKNLGVGSKRGQHKRATSEHSKRQEKDTPHRQGEMNYLLRKT